MEDFKYIICGVIGGLFVLAIYNMKIIKGKFVAIFKSKNLNDEINNLECLNNQILIVKKTNYLKESKLKRDCAKNFRCIASSITILITIITFSILMADNMYLKGENIINNNLKYRMEIIKQKDVGNDEKIRQQEELLKTIYDPENISMEVERDTYMYFMGAAIIILIVEFLLLTIAWHFDTQASIYESMVEYINDKIHIEK